MTIKFSNFVYMKILVKADRILKNYVVIRKNYGINIVDIEVAVEVIVI
jgi:hypothetical protein